MNCLKYNDFVLQPSDNDYLYRGRTPVLFSGLKPASSDGTLVSPIRPVYAL
jgi:hypothetical protein